VNGEVRAEGEAGEGSSQFVTEQITPVGRSVGR